jgi:hypothetical protein
MLLEADIVTQNGTKAEVSRGLYSAEVSFHITAITGLVAVHQLMFNVVVRVLFVASSRDRGSFNTLSLRRYFYLRNEHQMKTQKGLRPMFLDDG